MIDVYVIDLNNPNKNQVITCDDKKALAELLVHQVEFKDEFQHLLKCQYGGPLEYFRFQSHTFGWRNVLSSLSDRYDECVKDDSPTYLDMFDLMEKKTKQIGKSVIYSLKGDTDEF